MVRLHRAIIRSNALELYRRAGFVCFAAIGASVLGGLAMIVDHWVTRGILALLLVPTVMLAYPLGELIGGAWCKRGLTRDEQNLIEAMRFLARFNDHTFLVQLASDKPGFVRHCLEQIASDSPDDEVVRLARRGLGHL
jgi:hypothetical protein